MPSGFRRNFFTVEVSILDHPKWTALTKMQQRSWFIMRALAERQFTQDFESREQLERLLRREGDTQARKTIERFIELRLLDEFDDRLTVHNLERYRARSLSTDRVMKHRETTRNDTKRFETPTDRQTDMKDRQTAPASAKEILEKEAPKEWRELGQRLKDKES